MRSHGRMTLDLTGVIEEFIRQRIAHEKVLIISHQGNANQNHKKLSPHPCQDGCCQKDEKQQVLEKVWWRGLSYTLCEREWKLVQPPWKTTWRFLKKIKMELHYDPVNPLWVYIQNNTNSKEYVHPNVHCKQSYLQYPRYGRNSSAHQQMRK